jgi:hypothetical protein
LAPTRREAVGIRRRAHAPRVVAREVANSG